MNTFTSTSTEATASFAARLAEKSMPGDIICLSGELGAGKTVFAQGFAEGMGYKGQVTSPTFTILQIYEGGRLPIYHFDLYRLENDMSELEGIGYEEYFYASVVTLIEWPEIVPEAIPDNVIHIEIKENEVKTYRDIICNHRRYCENTSS